MVVSFLLYKIITHVLNESLLATVFIVGFIPNLM
jgi:hypothetical protein